MEVTFLISFSLVAPLGRLIFFGITLLLLIFLLLPFLLKTDFGLQFRIPIRLQILFHLSLYFTVVERLRKCGYNFAMKSELVLAALASLMLGLILLLHDSFPLLVYKILHFGS